jgi:hypothetical protein
MAAFVDLTGTKFGRLTVLGLDQERSTKKRKYWTCLCDCGTQCSKYGDNIKAEKVKSCGCLVKESQLKTAAKRKQFTHEQLKMRHIWQLIMRRCYNPQDCTYKYYGGRGITVCKRWHDFNLFYEDMSPRPPKFSLDRIANDGNYSPGNCRWTDAKTQANNRRGNRLETINGTTKTVSEWCEIYGIKNPSMIYQRLKRGWTMHDALSVPPRVCQAAPK